MNTHSSIVPTILTIHEKLIIGMQMQMSFAENKTAKLWQLFMPRKGEIENRTGTELISMQLYPETYSFMEFNPDLVFTKWAAVEVFSTINIPAGMEQTTIPNGLYAIFHYKGLNTDTTIFENIFNTWIPQSGYAVDQRPHFEILGNKYKNSDQNSEEDIYIPIK